jgi:hypothetical protein
LHKSSNRSLSKALHTLAINWRPSPHSSTAQHSSRIRFYIAPRCGQGTCSIFLLFDATHCGPSVFFLLLHVVRTCTPGLQSHPIAEPLVRPRPTRAFSPSVYRPLVHVVRFCPTSCSTAPCLLQIDWLTCRISSTSSGTAIGGPFLFGAGLHRSDWLSCTS